MEEFIGCDAHKKYSVFVTVNERGRASPEVLVGHDREQYRQFLERLPAGSQIALEASGHYYCTLLLTGLMRNPILPSEYVIAVSQGNNNSRFMRVH